MTLNQEEKKKLRANIEKIDAYIKSEICPYLHGSSITVGVSIGGRRKRSSKSTTSFALRRGDLEQNCGRTIHGETFTHSKRRR